MKVIKLKNGYRISTNDGDFEVLTKMVESVESQDNLGDLQLSGPAKAAHTRRTKNGQPFLRVDDNRRGA